MKFPFYLLGKVKIAWGDNEEFLQLPKKSQALLIFLAVEGSTFTREFLASLLWSEFPQERARANLRDSLSRLPDNYKNILEITPSLIRIHSDARLWLDAVEFESSLQNLKNGSQHPDFSRSQFEQIAQAIELYRGDFLAGFSVSNVPLFEEWAEVKREHFHQMAIKALSNLTNYCIKNRDISNGLKFTHKLLQMEPWHEQAHRDLMRMLALSGKRSEALNQFNLCRRILADEFNSEPSPETKELHLAILTGSLNDERVVSLSPDSQFEHGSLPKWDTSFVGREQEQREIDNMLHAHRLVSICGLGGIGKSRLAVKVAEARQDCYQDGVYFVPLLSQESVAAVVSEIAHKLGLVLQEGGSPRKQLLSYLRHRKALLVLDNMERFLDENHSKANPPEMLGFIEDMLQAAPHLTLLITSRERLRLPQERAFDLKGLPVKAAETEHEASAIELFLSRARESAQFDRQLEGEDLTRIRKICQFMEGMPLAIELAASQLQYFSLSGLDVELFKSHHVLDASLRGSGARHSSIAIVFETSWENLSQNEKAVLARLSVFRGGFTYDAAVKVAQADLATLSSLLNKSFIRFERSGRFSQHTLVLVFAKEQLAQTPDEQAAALNCHQRYFRSLLNEAIQKWQVRHDPDVMEDLVLDVDNFRGSWQGVLSHSNWDEIDAYLADLWQFLRILRRIPEAIELIQEALNKGYSAQPEVLHVKLARWERMLGESFLWLSEFTESDEHYRRALELLHRWVPESKAKKVIGSLVQLIIQFIHRMVPAYFVGRLRNQENALEASIASQRVAHRLAKENDTFAGIYYGLQALNMAEASGKKVMIARSYAITGYMLAMIRLRWFAERYFKWAEVLAGELADPEVDELVCACYGLYLSGIGRLEEAKISSTRAADTAARLSHLFDHNTYLLFLIYIAYQQGDFSHSLEIARNLGDSARQRGDAVFFAASLYWQGLIKLLQNDLDEVIELLNESSSYLSNEHNPFDWIMLHSTLAQAYHRKGDAVAALQQANIATKILSEITIPTHSLTLFGYFGTSKVYLSLWEQQSGQIDQMMIQSAAHQACKRLEAAVRIFPVGLPRARLYRGWYEWLSGNKRKALRNWQKSLAAAKKLDMPYEMGLAHFELGRHLIINNVESGHDHLHQALKIFDRLGAEYELGCTQSFIAAPAI